jgi:hypothetical protein
MRGERAEIGGEAGQASVEWLGLLLVAALALGALAAVAGVRPGRAPASDRGVGELVAERLACAARGSCVAGARRSGALPAGARPPSSDALPAAPRVHGKSRARAIEALRRLRAVGSKLVKRAWIVCIGYRRFSYEMEHPRAPNEAMPVEEAIDIANGCLNPYAFLAEDE